MEPSRLCFSSTGSKEWYNKTTVDTLLDLRDVGMKYNLGMKN